MRIDETKLGLIAIIQKMPFSNENEIAKVIEDMVEHNLLPRSSPVASTNHAVNSALFTINKWMKKVEP